jgi:hypothetical protein
MRDILAPLYSVRLLDTDHMLNFAEIDLKKGEREEKLK